MDKKYLVMVGLGITVLLGIILGSIGDVITSPSYQTFTDSDLISYRLANVTYTTEHIDHVADSQIVYFNGNLQTESDNYTITDSTGVINFHQYNGTGNITYTYYPTGYLKTSSSARLISRNLVTLFIVGLFLMVIYAIFKKRKWRLILRIS